MTDVKSLANSANLATMINWLIVGAALWLTTNFVWSFWPQMPTQIETSTPRASSTKSFDLQKVLNADLFGSTDQAAAEQPKEITAPVTRLNLKLRGVYSSEDEYATAMIEHNRKQEVYRIGNSLPGATGLTLYQVLSDRVIMSRNNKYETLFIEDFDGSTPSAPTQVRPRTMVQKPEPVDLSQRQVVEPSQGRSVIDKSNDQEVTRQLLELRENLEDPTALTAVVNMTPVTNDQGFQGFRLAPGNNRELFGRLGLRRNDILTAVNGIVMSDPTAGLTIYEQLTSADEINLSVLRGTRELEIKLSAAENF